MRAATRADLENAPRGAFLYCPECGARYSATPGDYWHLSDDYAFTCDHEGGYYGSGAEDDVPLAGDAPMILATEYVEIRPVHA